MHISILKCVLKLYRKISSLFNKIKYKLSSLYFSELKLPENCMKVQKEFSFNEHKILHVKIFLEIFNYSVGNSNSINSQ